jgi:hypothetical protein
MANKLRCRFCGGEHKATSDNFPLVLYGNVEQFEGKGKNRKRIMPDRPGVIGNACKKCVAKGARESFIKEHNIKASPGQRIADTIKKKIEELKLKTKGGKNG